MAYMFSDSRRRAGQYIGLADTPLKIQQDESRVKRVLGRGGRRKVFISSRAAAWSETRPNLPQSTPASPAVSPPIRWRARYSGESTHRKLRISSTSAQPTVYSVATCSMIRRRASSLVFKV